MAAGVIDLDMVTMTRVNPDGVVNILLGHLVSRRIRNMSRDCVKHFYGSAGVATYRKIKYPRGEGSDTRETRIAAARWAMDRMTDLVVKYYASYSDLFE
jgi:hypothetical protein